MKKIQRFEGVEGYGDRTLHMGGYSEKKQTYRNIKLLLLGILCLCVLSALQTTILSGIPLFILPSGTPSLCLLFVLAAGYVFGEREGCVTGILGGIAAECVTMDPLFGGIMIYPLIYCILGYVSGGLSKVFLAENLPSFTVYAMMGYALEGICRWGLHILKVGALPPLAYIYGGLLPGFILTTLCSPLIYLLLWVGKKQFDKA